ncbi:MAG: DUF58 domain-containing protein [Myxococcales bacterium]|nr:DUF58 domain-containing protein [Myxococcales bacterium]
MRASAFFVRTRLGAAAVRAEAAVSRLRALLARAWPFLRRVVDLWPLTWLGALVVALALAALRWLAFADLDLTALVLGYGTLGVVLVAVVTVAATAFGLRRRLRKVPAAPTLVVETDAWTPTGLRPPSLGWVPLIRIDWRWRSPASADAQVLRRLGRLEERVRVAERGETRELVRRLLVGDVFGLARVAVEVPEARGLRALPNLGALGHLPALASPAGGGDLPHPLGLAEGDRVDMRRYVAGDPARFIHWKVFGRTRRLMVRVPERALTRAHRTIAYLVAGPRDEPSAAAARVAIERGLLGAEWSFAADGTPGATSTVADAISRVVHSAGARDEGAAGLAAFVERAERSGPASLVLFAPPAPGAWLDRTLAVVRRRVASTRVVIGVDALYDGSAADRRRWRWLLRSGAPVAGTELGALERVCAVLGAARVEVVVLERPTGRVLGAPHRAALRSDRLTAPPRTVPARDGARDDAGRSAGVGGRAA